jgi:hypothetical protein
VALNVPLPPVTLTVAFPAAARSGTVADFANVPFEPTTALPNEVDDPSMKVMVSVWPGVKLKPDTVKPARPLPQAGDSVM